MWGKREVVKINKQTEQIHNDRLELAEELKDKRLRIMDVKNCKYTMKDIIFNSNVGQVEMSYSDSFEVAWTILDALGILDNDIENQLRYANKKHDLGKF